MLNLDINHHFSERSVKYNDGNSWIMDQSVLAAISSFLPTSFSRLIDLGAGTCVVSQNIVNTIFGDYEVFAVDINESMLNKCNNPKINRIVSDIGLIPFSDNYFDVVVTRQCLHYIKYLQRIIQEIKRIIIPSGTVILAQIVPFDKDTFDLWANIVKIRQPLRQNYFDSEIWTSIFVSNGFQLINSHHLVTRSSVNDWIYKYNVSEPELIKNIRKLFVTAPSDYKEKYCVNFEKNDITYNLNWFIAQFCLETGGI